VVNGAIALSIVVPPFVQYQSPIVPLRGLWNAQPGEGDRFVTCEIDWSVTTGPGMAVQFALSGNSPVALSQIVAFNVDNTRNAVDVSFLFPDSGYTLLVPAYSQGVFPVFTNALMFYATAPGADAGDRTVFQVLNSMPPPVSIARTQEQETASVVGFSLETTGTYPVIAAGINGTLILAQMNFVLPPDVAGDFAQVALEDGNGRALWVGLLASSAAEGNVLVSLGPVRIGFVNGVVFNVLRTALPPSGASGGTVNVYYESP